EGPEPKVVKNRLPLDLRVGGGLEVPVALRRQRVEAEVDRVIGAGATRLRTFDEVVADRYFVVMQDPEGNVFCLTSSARQPLIELVDLALAQPPRSSSGLPVLVRSDSAGG